MQRRLFLSAAIAATLAAGAAHAQQPRTELRIGMAAEDIGRLDPHFATTTIDKAAVGWIFGGLVRFRPGSLDPATIEGDLAERWESSPDGRTWTFHLRRGVQFQHNYGEVTAADVAWSLNRARTAATSGFAGDFRAFQSVEAVDPYTVRIQLSENVPSLLGLVAGYHGGNIVSRRAVEERGQAFNQRPVGFGPFQVAEHRPRQSLELEAHQGYYRGRPRIARISYRFIASDATRDLAFTNGELDINYGTQDQRWIDRMRQVQGAAVEVFGPAELSILNLNITAAPLNDIRVRQAIAHAIDRNELVRFRGADMSVAGQSLVPIGYLGFQAQQLPAFNQDRARQLLREAGHPNGLTIRIIHTQLPGMLSTIQVVQAQLRRVGINLEIEVVEHATFHAQIRRDLSPIVHYAAARFPVADFYLTQFFHSRSIVQTPTAVTNFSHCGMADQEIDQARVATDPATQIRLWQEAQRKLSDAVCGIPLFEQRLAWVRRANFEFGYQLVGSLSLGPLITEQSHFR